MRWHFGWLLITREQNLTLNLYPPEARTLFQCSNVRRGGYSGWHWAIRVGTMLMMISPRRRKVNGAVIFDVSAWLAGGNGDAAKKIKKFLIFFFFGLCGFWLGVLGLIYGMGGGAFLIWRCCEEEPFFRYSVVFASFRCLKALGFFKRD